MRIKSWFKPKAQTLVGVDIGSSSVKLAQLKRNGGKSFKLQQLGREQLPHDSIADGVIISKLSVADAMDKLFKACQIEGDRIATSICGHSVIVKKVSLPSQSPQELAASIQWEAEQYIPFDISEVNLDYQVIGESTEGGRMDVLLVAAKKDKITDHTTVISMTGHKPAVVDIDAFAVQNAFEVNYQPEDSTVAALLDVGSNMINIVIVKGREFMFTRDIAMGGSQYNEALQKEFTISFEEAEQIKSEEAPTKEEQQRVQKVLDDVSEILTLEIQKTFDFFKTNSESVDIRKLYLSGGASRTRGLKACLQQNLEVDAEYLDPFKGLEIEDTVAAHLLQEGSSDFAVAVGLALRSERER
jgi:type IV pilus assembly protein PilM